MGLITTFYSYKGGVGRSMALANVAWLLASRGLKVLAVDWDLEAPGLEQYFSSFEIGPGGKGLLRLLTTSKTNASPTYKSYKDYATLIHCGTRHPITLLASGRKQDPEYSQILESFDWDDFFRDGGGSFLEGLRDRWKLDFDAVLIDSRTGLSDSGGICTILLPDAVVAMFTANFQSLYGVRDVLRLAQAARQKLAYDRMPLSVLPVPSRWGTQEFGETKIWLDRISEGMDEFFLEWLPKGLRPRQVLEAIKVPHVSYFSFGERLAAFEHGIIDPQGLGFTYQRIASFLASNFDDVTTLVGKDALALARKSSEETSTITAPLRMSRYDYDIFMSFEHSSTEWVHTIVPLLSSYVEMQTGRKVEIFSDISEFRPIIDSNSGQIERSLLFIPIITDSYFSSKFTLREFDIFKKSNMDWNRRTIGFLLNDLPNNPIESTIDFRKAGRQLGSSSISPELHRRLEQAAEVIAHRILSIK